jgi:hypothetical protein
MIEVMRILIQKLSPFINLEKGDNKVETNLENKVSYLS